MPTVGLKSLSLSAKAPRPGSGPTTAEGRAIETQIKIGWALVRLLEADPDPRAPEVAARLTDQIKELENQLIQNGGV